jgi:hypothetical protein
MNRFNKFLVAAGSDRELIWSGVPAQDVVASRTGLALRAWLSPWTIRRDSSRRGLTWILRFERLCGTRTLHCKRSSELCRRPANYRCGLPLDLLSAVERVP